MNEQNLIPFTKEQSREEAKKNGQKGGKKSGEVRRKRKAMEEQMERLLALPFNLVDRNGNEVKKVLESLGFEEEEIDNQMAMIISLWKTAMSSGRNQVSAFQEIRKIVKDDEEQSKQERVQIINDLPEDEEDEAIEDETESQSMVDIGIYSVVVTLALRLIHSYYVSLRADTMESSTYRSGDFLCPFNLPSFFSTVTPGQFPTY